MRSSAPLALFCLAACLCGCEGLRSEALAPPKTNFTLFRLTSPEARVGRVASLKRWAKLGLWYLGLDGKKIGTLLFGTEPGSLATVFMEKGRQAEPGCSKQDGLSAENFVKEKAMKWFKGVSDAMSEVGNEVSHLGPMSTEADLANMQFEMAKKLGDSMNNGVKMMKKDMPKTCHMDMKSADMPRFMSCAHQLTGISKGCLRCGTKFYSGMSSTCQHTCLNSMWSMEDKLTADMQSIMQELAPSLGNAAITGTIPPEVQKKLEDKMQVIGEKMIKGLRVLVPCVECTRKRFDALLTCLNFDNTWKDDMNKMAKELEGELMHPNITVDIHPETQGQPSQPVMPLA